MSQKPQRSHSGILFVLSSGGVLIGNTKQSTHHEDPGKEDSLRVYAVLCGKKRSVGIRVPYTILLYDVSKRNRLRQQL